MFVLQPSFASDLPKPTIIVITGAFMHHIAYNDFAQSLSHTGHRVLLPELASSWSLRPTGEPVKVDVEALRCHIVRQVDAGNEIILVMHSYGCIIGGAAAKGLSKKEQEAKGEKGGVLGLIFIAGYIVEEGTAVKDTLPGGVLESTEEYPIGEPTFSGYTNAVPDLYRQMYDPAPIPESSFRANFKNMLMEGKSCLTSPSPKQGWADEGFNGRRAYIRATQDTCLLLSQQTAMIDASGVEWMVEDMDAGYNICKTHTTPLTELVTELMFRFEAAE